MSNHIEKPQSRPQRIRSEAAIALAAVPVERVLLSVADAAKYLGVSEKTIRRYIDAALLKAYRFGPKLIRLERQDLDALGVPAHPAFA